LYGEVEREGSEFIVSINPSHSLSEQIGTLFHELSHVIFWMIFTDGSIDEKREHKFCEQMDRGAKAAMKSYLGIK